MSACHDGRGRVALYVDGELGAAEAASLELHLERCGSCRAELQALRGLSQGLREHASYHRAPASLRARVFAFPDISPNTSSSPSVEPLAGPRWRSAALLRWALPIAASLVLVASLQWNLIRPPRRTDLADELVSAHVRSLMADHLADVASTDQHTVKPWFEGRLDFAPSVRDLAAEGYPLTGGRLDYIGHRTVAALVYRDRLHVINLFEWPDPACTAAAVARTISGFNLVQWCSGGLRYWAISDLNSEELHVFAVRLGAG